MLREGIGFALCLFGVVGADSADFILPAIAVILGAYLLLTSGR